MYALGNLSFGSSSGRGGKGGGAAPLLTFFFFLTFDEPFLIFILNPGFLLAPFVEEPFWS